MAALALAGAATAGSAGSAGSAATAGQPGASLAVAPLGREQAAAFYVARGFAAEAVAMYAGGCVLSFTFRNDGAVRLRTRLADWRAGDGVRFRALETWEAEWARRGVPAAARIAFRWAQFPPQQEFEPGDWIMGMALPEVRIAGPFRVAARYEDERGEHEVVSDVVTCAD